MSEINEGHPGNSTDRAANEPSAEAQEGTPDTNAASGDSETAEPTLHEVAAAFAAIPGPAATDWAAQARTEAVSAAGHSAPDAPTTEPVRTELAVRAPGEQTKDVPNLWSWLDVQLSGWSPQKVDDAGLTLSFAVEHAVETTDGQVSAVAEVTGPAGGRQARLSVLDTGTSVPPAEVLADEAHGPLTARMLSGDTGWSRELAFETQEQEWISMPDELKAALELGDVPYVHLNVRNELAIAVPDKRIPRIARTLAPYSASGRPVDPARKDLRTGIGHQSNINGARLRAGQTHIEGAPAECRFGDEVVELLIYPVPNIHFTGAEDPGGLPIPVEKYTADILARTPPPTRPGDIAESGYSAYDPAQVMQDMSEQQRNADTMYSSPDGELRGQLRTIIEFADRYAHDYRVPGAGAPELIDHAGWAARAADWLDWDSGTDRDTSVIKANQYPALEAWAVNGDTALLRQLRSLDAEQRAQADSPYAVTRTEQDQELAGFQQARAALAAVDGINQGSVVAELAALPEMSVENAHFWYGYFKAMGQAADGYRGPAAPDDVRAERMVAWLTMADASAGLRQDGWGGARQ